MLMVLYIFGHFNRATQISDEIIPHLESLWTIRCTRMVYFYAALAIIARLREDSSLKSQQNELLAIVEKYKAKIEEWQSHCNVNYLMWSLLIQAEVCELRRDYHNSIQAYEAAVDHAQLYDFNLDIALILESQACFFVRRGARRAAVTTLKDAMAAYSSIGAAGKVEQLTTKHEFLLSSCTAMGIHDAAVQTENSVFGTRNAQLPFNASEQIELRNVDGDIVRANTKAWVNPEPDNSGPDRFSLKTDLGLDILDLTSILKFSQAISSELDIDKLLIKMMEIIMSSAGSTADVFHMVTESENEWTVAASGDSDGISAPMLPVKKLNNDSQKQVILYTTRFREVVFLHNVQDDDRFLHSSLGQPRSVLSLPVLQGKEILGVLFLVSLFHDAPFHALKHWNQALVTLLAF